MRVIRLTRHFMERWNNGDGDPMRRIQMPLDIWVVNQILDESVQLQGQKMVYLKREGAYVPHLLLASFWHPTMHLLLKVDIENGVAVTVVNRRKLEQRAYYNGDEKVGGTD